jgi:hypothetical protein
VQAREFLNAETTQHDLPEHEPPDGATVSSANADEPADSSFGSTTLIATH